MSEMKLTNLEFAAALKRGQGRALQHVRQHGLSDMRNLVLESCLKNPAYDRQCEGSRAAWLFRMFQDAEDYDLFSAAILSALSSLPSDADCYDLEHLCELAALMAKAGDEAAASALRSRVLAQPVKWPYSLYGCQPLVVLDGVSAVIALARRFGQLLIDEPGERPPSVGYLTEDLGIFDAAAQELWRLAETDVDIKRYLDNEEVYTARERESEKKTPEERRQEIRERARKELTLDGLLNDASRGIGEYPGRYMRFGKYATDDELKIVLQRLIKETEDAVCLRLLWIFRRTPLPELHPKIWQLADSKDDSIRYSAVEALAQSQARRVGELGRSRLLSGAFTSKDSETLDLFIRNYQPQDERLILSALAPLSPDEDEAHSLGSSLLKICENNTARTSLDMLKWVYESTPCTVCRFSAVKQMAEIGGVPPEILAECVDDADGDLRHLAKELVVAMGQQLSPQAAN